MSTIEEIRKVIADTDTPFDTRIARVAALVAPVTQGQRVNVTACVEHGQEPGTEVHADADGDVRVRVRIGDFEDYLYVPVKEIR